MTGPTPRHVLVTGAARGIGEAIARRFLEAGDMVSIVDRDAEAAHSTATALRRTVSARAGGAVEAFACDVSDDDLLEETLDAAKRHFGAIDVLVGNAGMQHVAAIEAFPIDRFRQMLDVMVVAPFVALRKVLPEMKQRGRGRVLHVASINGLVGFAGKAGYNTAKHALVGLTKVAALEAAPHGVTVNALCPGYVDTPLVRGQLADLARERGVDEAAVLESVIYPLVPQRRLLAPVEVANYAFFLASDEAASVTGQAVVLDGGYVAQ